MERLHEEIDENGTFHIYISELEHQVSQHSEGAVEDDTSGLQRELQIKKRNNDKLFRELRKLEESEQADRSEDAMMFERLHFTESLSQGRQDSIRQAHRVIQQEEQCEKDTFDMIEFRRNELESFQSAMIKMGSSDPDLMATSQARRGSAQRHMDPEVDSEALVAVSEKQTLEMELNEAWHSQREFEQDREHAIHEQNSLEEALCNLEEQAAQHNWAANGDDEGQFELSPVERSELASLSAALQTEKDLVLRLRSRLKEEEERARQESAAAERAWKAHAEHRLQDLQDLPALQLSAAGARSSGLEDPLDQTQVAQQDPALDEQRALRGLQQKLFDSEHQLRILRDHISDRRRIMRGETTLLTGVLHEVTLRCHQMTTRHRLAVDERANREVQAPGAR